jgi:ABC-2 type transport system permease protein
MSAITAPANSAISSSVPGFAATLRSEWTKLRSVRTTWIIVGLAIGLSIGVSALVALVTGMTFDGWGTGAQETYDPVMNSMSGLLFRLILLVTLGVTVVTSEYTSGMIRTTFMVNPRRTQVLAAKTLIVGGLAIAVGAVTMPGMFLVSQPIFSAYGLPTASIMDGDTVRFLVVYAVGQTLVYTFVPFFFAWVLRGTASAITVGIGFLLLPQMLSPVMPVWIKTNVLSYSPDLALDSLAGVTVGGTVTHLSESTAIIVIAAWLVGLFAVAAVTLNRRDV